MCWLFFICIHLQYPAYISAQVFSLCLNVFIFDTLYRAWPRSTTDSMEVSGASDLGSIPNAATTSFII